MIISSQNPYFPIRKLVTAFLNYLLPKTFLQTQLESAIGVVYEHAFDTILVNSGRSALYELLVQAKNLERFRKRSEVLVPSYICNVVDKAVVRSGLVRRTYETDRFFRPIVEDLRAHISRKTLAVVLAPIFGSYDDVFVDAASLVKKTSQALVILDNAQSLDRHPPPEVDAVILSFNNKDIWGVMGGALVTRRNRFAFKFAPEELCFREELLYLSEMCARVSKILHEKSRSCSSSLNVWQFEHSDCSRFPYEISTKGISKVSLVFALLGLRELEGYKARRKNNYNALKHWIRTMADTELIETKNASTSAFVPARILGSIQDVLSIFTDLSIELKMPYAVDGDPKSSVRSEVIAIPNKPELDYRKILAIPGEGRLSSETHGSCPGR